MMNNKMKCVRRCGYDSSCIVVVVPAGNDFVALRLMIYEARQVILHYVDGFALANTKNSAEVTLLGRSNFVMNKNRLRRQKKFPQNDLLRTRLNGTWIIYSFTALYVTHLLCT